MAWDERGAVHLVECMFKPDPLPLPLFILIVVAVVVGPMGVGHIFMECPLCSFSSVPLLMLLVPEDLRITYLLPPEKQPELLLVGCC